MSSGRQIFVVDSGPTDSEVTVNNFDCIPTTNENRVKVQTLEKCFTARVDREMGNIVETVEDGIPNVILTAVVEIIPPRIELAVRLINASSRQVAAIVTANSERREHIVVTASSRNVSDWNNTLHELLANNENIPDELGEYSVPRTHFDLKSHTHYTAFVN